MVNKLKLVYIIVIIFLVINILFLSAQELTKITEISSQDFSYYGENAELIDDALVCKTGFEKCKIEIRKGDITTTIEATQGIKVSPLGKISVAESGAEFSINGNTFKNIQSGEIIFDQTNGKITQADFFTNENIGDYNINGNEFNVPANKRFFYDSKKQEFQLSEGTEIKKATETKIQGENLIYFKGNEQHSVSGNLNFDENGNAFVSAKEKIIINGVSLENQGKGPDFPIFFDKNTAETSGKTEYVIADLSKKLFAFKESGGNLPRNIRIEFNKENYLFGDLMDEKDYLFIGEGGVNPGYLEITKQGKNLPVLKTQGGIEVNPDEKRFLFENENIIFRTGTNAWPIPEDRSMISGTVPMVFESQDRKVIGLIPDNNDKYFYWTTKGGKVSYGPVSGVIEEQLGVELPDEITKSWAENSEVSYKRSRAISILASNSEIKTNYRDYLTAEKSLKKYNKEIEKLKEELLAKREKGKDPSISWAELEEKIGKEKTSEIKTALKNRVKLIDSIYETLKIEELEGDASLTEDIEKFKPEEEMSKVLSLEELKNLNKCISLGRGFDSCFDESYKYLGLLTLKCITDANYCKRLTFYEFNKIRTK